MAIPTVPNQGDLARTKSIEADESYPTTVTLSMYWPCGPDGQVLMRSIGITADQYFGHGQYGAPIPAEFLVQQIERMRREGPPQILPQIKRPAAHKNRIKTLKKAKR
jgi:hypothetical protein